jgi:hypothetical protein
MEDTCLMPDAVGVSRPGEGLFGTGIRRDIADLNTQFLGLCVDPGLADDPRLHVPDEVRSCLAACPPEARRRMACCHFSLFQLNLPEPAARGGGLQTADLASLGCLGAASPATSSVRDFALLSLAVARQLAAQAPLAFRIALGLGSAQASRLAGLGPSDIATLAERPGLVGPRWSWHDRHWRLLAAAAQSVDGLALQRAHALGLCLPEAACPGDSRGTARRRQPPAGGPPRRVPC